MDLELDLSNICRVCLKEGEMRPIHDECTEYGMQYLDKIVQCCNVELSPNPYFPKNICLGCITELNTAYVFRMNIESSDVLLESYLESQIKLKSSPITNEIYLFDTGDQNYLTMANADAAITYSPSHTVDLVDIDVKSNMICVGADSEFIEFLEMSEDEINENEPVGEHTDTKPQNLELLKFDQPDESILPDVMDNGNQQTLCTLVKIKNEAVPILSIEKKAGQNGVTGAKIHINRRNITSKKKKPEKCDLICQICAKIFTGSYAMQIHLRRHNQEKPYVCAVLGCGKSFVMGSMLKRHNLTHTKERPYQCRFCTKTYTDFGGRQNHERTHTGERPFLCKECGQSFAYAYVLKNHILIHTGEKRFECVECGKRFTKSHHLKQHQNVHLREQGKQPIHTYSKRKETRLAKVPANVYLDYGEQKIEVETVSV